MSSTNPWAPPGESAGDLWEERSNYYGVPLSSAAYGVHFTLYCIVMQHLIQNPPNRGPGKSKIPWGLVVYITWNFILGTIGQAAEIKFNELTFITDRNFPGGPDAFVVQEYGMFVNIFGTVAYVILNYFADGLVIYRFWLIYNFNYYIAALPIILLLASFSMGVMLLFQLTQPNANLWTTTTVNFAIPYWSISASLNILVTLLIVGRLLYIRQRTRALLSSSHSRTYTGIAAMLVESAALYSVTALLFIITYARDSNIQNIVLPLLGQVQAISPLLIMWRVARGQAITRETMMKQEQSLTISKISWRNGTSTTGQSSTASAHGSRSMLRPISINTAGVSPTTTQSRSFATTTTQLDTPVRTSRPPSSSYQLSPSVSFHSGLSTGKVDDADSLEDGWEMEERGETKIPPLEVVVERQVEQWDGETRVVRGNAL